jgi:hypothetical protein
MRDMVTHGPGLALLALAASLTGAACGHPKSDLAPTPDARLPSARETLFTSVPEPSGPRCRWGGTKTGTGLDLNGNGVLERQEIVTISYACQARSNRPALAGRQGSSPSSPRPEARGPRPFP